MLNPIKGLIGFISKRSLKTKLVTIFVILTTIPFSVVGFVSYTRFYSTIEAKTIESTTQLAEQLNQSISSTFQIGERFSKIIQSEAIIRFLTAKDNESLATYESAKDIGKLFKLYRDTFDDYQWIKGIYIIGFNGNNISEAQGVYKLGKDLDSISTVNKILSKPDELLIIPNSHIDYARDQFDEEVISLGTTVVIPTTNQVIGVIIVDIDKRAIEVLSEDLRIGNTGYFTIISEGDDGVVTIFCSDSHENRCELKSENLDRILEESSGHFTAKMNAKREFVVFNTLSEVGWKIVGRVELQDLMKSAYTIRTVTIFVVVLSFIFTAVLYLFISDRLTRPIRELREKMKQAEQGLLVTTDGQLGHDEIGDLQRGFNRMIKNIVQLIEDNKKEQESLKKAELKALQAQINPHFLYNTLDAIVWMAETKNNTKVVEITKAFSTFFRTALSKGKEWITVEEEVEHVKSYLMIQSARYRDILSSRIDVDDQIWGCRILKLILQPIVENSLYHGIKNKRTPGMIEVKLAKKGDAELYLEVTDNGKGMTAQRLADLTAYLEDEGPDYETSLGFGLKNVNQRIKLYYGKQYGLTVKSEHGKGTCVSAVIPIVRDEDV